MRPGPPLPSSVPGSTTPSRVPSVAGVVWRFASFGLIAMALVVGASVLLSQSVGREAAQEEARRITRLTGLGIIEPLADAGLLAGSPGSLETLNDAVTDAVIDGSLVRVKVWQPDGAMGTVRYSDESRLIGQSFPLDQTALDALAGTGGVVGVADLSRPENRFESGAAQLLEVYQPIDGPAGTTLLYEAYFDQRGVDAAGRRVWFAFAPLVVGALLLLQAVQVPLAWSMARRLRRGAEQQQRLLERSLEASSLERRRIAADLHDGVVQDLAGLSYALSGAASSEDLPAMQAQLREAGRAVRSNVGALRTMLVDIYPPDLGDGGLPAALEDLLARHRAAGTTVDVDMDVRRPVPRPIAELVYRIAQEALRNIDKHAGADRVRLDLTVEEDRLVLAIEDDGRGFVVDRAVEGDEPHFGTRLLADSARDLGGRLTLSSAPGAGTRLDLEVPL